MSDKVVVTPEMVKAFRTRIGASVDWLPNEESEALSPERQAMVLVLWAVDGGLWGDLPYAEEEAVLDALASCRQGEPPDLPRRPGPTFARYNTIGHRSAAGVILDLARKLKTMMREKGLYQAIIAAVESLPVNRRNANFAPLDVERAIRDGDSAAVDLVRRIAECKPGELLCLTEVERVQFWAEVDLEFAVLASRSL